MPDLDIIAIVYGTLQLGVAIFALWQQYQLRQHRKFTATSQLTKTNVDQKSGLVTSTTWSRRVHSVEEDRYCVYSRKPHGRQPSNGNLSVVARLYGLYLACSSTFSAGSFVVSGPLCRFHRRCYIIEALLRLATLLCIGEE